MAKTRARQHEMREARDVPAVLTWCRQLGSEVKLCTWLSPSRQLRKQCRAAWYSPCCWSCCPSWKRPSLPPFSIPSPSRRPGSLPSELRRPRTNLPPPLLSSGCRRCARAPQVERGSAQPVREVNPPPHTLTWTRAQRQRRFPPGGGRASGRASVPASQGQVARGRLRQRRRLARRPDPFPHSSPLLLLPLPSPTLPGCSRKGGQRKWESIQSVSGRTEGQSHLCSLISGTGSSAELCSAQLSTHSSPGGGGENCKAGSDNSKSTNVCCPCLCVYIYKFT